MADGTLNIDTSDPQQLGRLAQGLPPVLPSLAKPRTDQTAMGGMPPVAGPSPEEQRLAGLRSQLETIQKTPTATERLQQKAGAYHEAHPGVIGRLGQVGAGILRGVDIGAEILAPNIARNVPGTAFSRAQRAGEAQKELASAETQAGQATERAYKQAEIPKMQAETAYKQKETELLGEPKPKEEKWEGINAPGGGPVLNAQGQALERESNSGQYRWSEMGGIPAQVKAGQEPLTQQGADRLNQLWNPILSKAKYPQQNPFTAGMMPEQQKSTETALNQATGREQGGVRIDIAETNLADRQRKEQETNAQTANQGRMNLYAQDNYNDVVKQWHKATPTATYAKDNVIITDLLNQEKAGKGVLSGTVGGAAVGSLIGGPAGALAGGGAAVIANLLNGPSTAILDSLKRQGISDQGYAVMQAYLNALPARMAWELNAGGLKASTMRFGNLIQKVVQTVPAPNTPKSAWDNAYKQYYVPMSKSTELKEKTLKLPADYKAPTKEEFYPPEAGGGAAPETKVYQGVTYTKQPDGTWAR